MIKAFALGTVAIAAILGSTFGASAQDLSAAQVAVIAACSSSALAADNGAQCAIALRALPPEEYAAIQDIVVSGAGANVALLDDAIVSSGVETGAITPVPPTQPTSTTPGLSSSPA